MQVPQEIKKRTAMLLFSCQVVSDSLGTPWTVAYQALLFMGFPRQEDWSELSFPFPRDLPDPGIESMSPSLAGIFFTTEPYRKPQNYHMIQQFHFWVFI